MKLHYFLAMLIALNFVSCKNEDKKVPPKIDSKDSIDTGTAPQPELEGNEDTAVQLTPSGESVQLKFNLQKGKTYDYDMAFDVDQQMGVQTMNNQMGFNYNLQVIDEKNKVKTIKVTYDKISMTITMGKEKVEYSSDKTVTGTDPFQMVSKMFGALKGKNFTMEVDEKGEIRNVNGFDKIGEAMVNEMSVPEASKQQVLSQFKSQFNSEAIKDMFSQAFNIFPDKPIKVGDTWQKQIKGLDGKIVITKYTLQEIKGSKVKLDARSKSTIDQISTFIVDAKTGLVTDGTILQKMEGDRKMVSRGKIVGREL